MKLFEVHAKAPSGRLLTINIICNNLSEIENLLDKEKTKWQVASLNVSHATLIANTEDKENILIIGEKITKLFKVVAEVEIVDIVNGNDDITITITSHIACNNLSEIESLLDKTKWKLIEVIDILQIADLTDTKKTLIIGEEQKKNK